MPIYYISSGFISRLNETEFSPVISYTLLFTWSLLLIEVGCVRLKFCAVVWFVGRTKLLSPYMTATFFSRFRLATRTPFLSAVFLFYDYWIIEKLSVGNYFWVWLRIRSMGVMALRAWEPPLCLLAFRFFKIDMGDIFFETRLRPSVPFKFFFALPNLLVIFDIAVVNRDEPPVIWPPPLLFFGTILLLSGEIKLLSLWSSSSPMSYLSWLVLFRCFYPLESLISTIAFLGVLVVATLK